MMEENDDEQYQKRMRKRVTDALKAAQIEEQKKEILRQFLEPKAYERLMNIRLSNHELYNQLVSMVVSLVQSNRVSGKITETQLKSILEKMTYKREPTIEFKHK
ncbi:MAG: DNA-binding protein [Candidatus Micrarchaeales archaeon]